MAVPRIAKNRSEATIAELQRNKITNLTERPECEGVVDVLTYVCENCGWDGMNQGDYHSGPYGYSPGVAYPGTQYGSGFDEEEEWNR